MMWVIKSSLCGYWNETCGWHSKAEIAPTEYTDEEKMDMDDWPGLWSSEEWEQVMAEGQPAGQTEQAKEQKMPGCEKCWNDAYGRSLTDTRKSQVEHLADLLRERKDNPCSPKEQAGDKSPPDLPSEQVLEGQLSKLHSQLATEKDRRRALVASCEGLIKSEDHPVGWSSQWRWGVWSIFRRDVAEAKMETTDDPKGKTEHRSESISPLRRQIRPNSDFPPGTLILIVGGGIGKTYFMRDILLPQVIQSHRNMFWSHKPYSEAEIPNYPECVVFLTCGVHNHQLLELKEFAVRHQCCIIVEYQTAGEVMQIHDSIQIEVPSPVLINSDVVIWMHPITLDQNLNIILRPVLVKNRCGDLQHPPFEMHDVELVKVGIRRL